MKQGIIWRSERNKPYRFTTRFTCIQLSDNQKQDKRKEKTKKAHTHNTQTMRWENVCSSFSIQFRQQAFHPSMSFLALNKYVYSKCRFLFPQFISHSYCRSLGLVHPLFSIHCATRKIVKISVIFVLFLFQFVYFDDIKANKNESHGSSLLLLFLLLFFVIG